MPLRGLYRSQKEVVPLPGEIRVRLAYEFPRYSKRRIGLFITAVVAPLIAWLTVLMIFRITNIFVLLIASFVFLGWGWGSIIPLHSRLLQPNYENEPSQVRLGLPHTGWFSLSSATMRVRTGYATFSFNPREITWKNSTTLIIQTKDSRAHLEFETPADATKAFESMLLAIQR